MVNRNKIKRQAKNVFPSDVEWTAEHYMLAPVKKICTFESNEYTHKIDNSKSVIFFWASLFSFGQSGLNSDPNIKIACRHENTLYIFDPLKPHFYIEKTGVYRGIHCFSFFAKT